MASSKSELTDESSLNYESGNTKLCDNLKIPPLWRHTEDLCTFSTYMNDFKPSKLGYRNLYNSAVYGWIFMKSLSHMHLNMGNGTGCRKNRFRVTFK